MNKHVKAAAQSTVTSKGQTTIPKQFRDALGIKDGTALRWTLQDGELRVKARTRRLEDFAGILGPPPNGRHVTVEEMNQAVLDEAADRFKRATRR